MIIAGLEPLTNVSFNVTLLTDPTDGGSVTGEGSYGTGNSVKVTAVPNEG